jgi:hypothetical protein
VKISGSTYGGFFFARRTRQARRRRTFGLHPVPCCNGAPLNANNTGVVGFQDQLAVGYPQDRATDTVAVFQLHRIGAAEGGHADDQ